MSDFSGLARFLKEHDVFYDSEQGKWHIGHRLYANLTKCLLEGFLGPLLDIYNLDWVDVRMLDSAQRDELHKLGLVKNISESSLN